MGIWLFLFMFVAYTGLFIERMYEYQGELEKENQLCAGYQERLLKTIGRYSVNIQNLSERVDREESNKKYFSRKLETCEVELIKVKEKRKKHEKAKNIDP